jgi:hypothetical protein
VTTSTRPPATLAVGEQVYVPDLIHTLLFCAIAAATTPGEARAPPRLPVPPVAFAVPTARSIVATDPATETTW